MKRIDWNRKRFLRSFKRLSPHKQAAVKIAVKLFVENSSDPRLDFKLRKGSRYHSIRAGARSDNLRIAMLKIEDDFFALEYVGNHDDLNSLDHQDR